MKHFYIITNSLKDKDFRYTDSVIDYITKNNGVCVCSGKNDTCPKDDNCKSSSFSHYNNAAFFPKDTECIIVLGGDGTIIQAARDLCSFKVPIAGINLGDIGYLAGIPKGKIRESLNDLMNDENYYVEKRMMLKGEIVRNGETVKTDISLNDIVVSRADIPTLIKISTYINGKFLTTYYADGIITTTPTGSTAYNFSAGGPILSPESSLIALTPVCSHDFNNRSIVFSDDVRIEISVDAKGNRQSPDYCALSSFDGDHTFRLKKNDRLLIEKSTEYTLLIRCSDQNFLDILRNKIY